MTARFRLGLCAAACLLASSVALAEISVFRTDTRESFREGTLDGVRLGELGAIELARPVSDVAAIEEPYVFAAAVHPEGWVVGTGAVGKVLLVRRDGSQEELFATPEPQVFAVWADEDGTVFAASSPAGKVYRQGPEGGEATVFYDPEELYVWDLQRRPGGGLLVATGARGRLWEVGDRGKAELLFDSGDHHVRTLAVQADGSLWAGTAGQGRVLRFADGQLTTLYDAAEPEVLALVGDGQGGVLAATAASEASLVDLSSGEEEGETEGVTVSEGQQPTTGSRAAGAAGPRSRLLHLSADGRSRQLASFSDETIHALAGSAEELWVGTGQDGRLYRFADGELALESDFDTSQVVALLSDGGEVAVFCTDTAVVKVLAAGRQRSGTYTSAVLDAERVARFGTFFWRGADPKNSTVELSFRSGISELPDATWSGWSEPARGAELGLRELPEGRFVQWRATLSGDGKISPLIRAAELTYLQKNLPPEITSFEVLPPGQILVPNNFNPQNQVYEPWSANREGIFDTLKAAAAEDNGRTKQLWKRGYRTLRWEAEDANEDELRYRLSFRPDGDDGDWLPVAGELEQAWFSFDAAALPDGVYRFHLAVADRPADPLTETQLAERISPPVVIDHTPPTAGSARTSGGVIEVEISDALSPLREASYSLDAGPWLPAKPVDGLLDGRREILRIDPGGDRRIVLLRVTDSQFNVLTLDLGDNKKP